MTKNFTKAICVAIFLLNVLCSEAQIVYTNIPDVTLKCTGNSCYKPYAIDLNNDGTPDFTIRSEKWSGTSVDYFGNHYRYNYASVVIHYYTMYYYAVSQEIKISVTEPYPSPGAAAHTNGSEIGSSVNWESDPEASGNFFYENYVILRAYDKPQNRYSGYWLTPEDRYLGIRFSINGQTYYGWVRLSVSVTNSPQATCIIKDYAYESTPGKFILAGDKGNSSTAKPPGTHTEEEVAASNELRVFPNPVSSTTTISYSLLKPEKISLTVYDVTGKLVKTIANKDMSEGRHQLTLDVKDLNAGIYLLRLQTSEFVRSTKLIVIK